MKFRELLKDRRTQVAAGVGVFLLLVGIFFVAASALIGNDEGIEHNSSTSKNRSSVKDDEAAAGDNDTSNSRGGVGIGSNVRGLIGSVKSTRNLKGLTLRINQIDVCKLPDLTAYVAVSSDAGDVSRLNAKEIEVRVDGTKIENPKFERVDPKSQPLSVTLVIDRSGSMRGEPMDQAKMAASSFVQKASPNDQVGVLSFDHTLSVLQHPNTDRNSALQNIASIQALGDTALYDAVAKGAEITSGCSRRALVILSDGGDTASAAHSLEQAVAQTNQAGIPAFVVGLKGATYDGSTLRTIAEGTGGQLFETASPAELASLYDKVDAQLKGQYYVGLKLPVSKTGGQHSISITSNAGGSAATSTRYFNY